MDSARTAHPPPPPRHPHPSHAPTHHYQPQTYASYPPPQPPTISTHPVAGQSQPAHSPVVDPRTQQHQYSQAAAQPSYPQHSPPAAPTHAQAAVNQYQHPPPPHHAALPPIAYAYQGGPHQAGSQQPQFGQEVGSGLPPVRPPSGPQASEGARDEGYYGQHNRSGHATPAPVTQRSYSHDHSHTPLTPAPGPHPSGSTAESTQATSKPMEHVMHQGYSSHNGIHHGGIPPHHAPPHEQHPSYASTPVMDHPPYSMQQSQPQMYHQQGYGPASQHAQYAASQAMNKRKPMRAQQACEQCRQRKQKCDEGQPCSFCKEQNITCTYRDTPPAKTDKNTEKLMGMMEQMIERFDQRMDNFDARLARLDGSQDVKPEIDGTSPASMSSKPQKAPIYAPRQQKLAQPKDHRTGPHKLMTLWPTAAALFNQETIPPATYVFAAEDRGVLRLYGRGEGIDDQDGTQPGGPASPARSDDSSDNAPTPREGIWGRGFLNNTNVGGARPMSLQGGLKADGSLDLDSHTINACFDSYMQHMHPMHPFLDRSRSRKLIDTFISRYSPDYQGKRTVTFAVGNDSESNRPLKRVRGNEPNVHSHSNHQNHANTSNSTDTHQKNPLTTERSPANAIVWLILALGKICQHREPLPGVVPDSRASTNIVVAHQLSGNALLGSSPLNPAFKPSPISPKTTPMTHATPPEHTIPRSEHVRSRRSSQDSGTGIATKNIEIIPGLAYYAKAAEIMGDQGDGNDLVHAQMYLLAGLYKGQLARVRESMSWLTRAGATCQVLIESHKLYQPTDVDDQLEFFKVVEKKLSDKRNYLIVMAAWSCLQLESDILAELPLPGSGISSLENMLIMPGGVIDDEDPYKNSRRQDRKSTGHDDTIIFQYYTAQLFLRRLLNEVHRELYGEKAKSKTVDEVRHSLLSFDSSLDTWRSTLKKHSNIEFGDDDPPANDILAARLRAKYWGAVYVSTRPFLDYCLHIMGRVREGQSVEQAAQDAKGDPRDPDDVMIFKAIQQMDKAEIWDYAMKCIRAALKSTVALDGIPPRLIVTNIHGTAHAQFGNMLVLAAAYSVKHVDPLVPKAEFQEKLQRTITFLRRLAPISPTCWHDALYLEMIQHKLFPVPEDAKAAYESEKEPLSATNSFSFS